MVTKMEKFTQKEYEDLRATLSELHMHPGMVVYKDESGNEIISKLYDWFINNTYELIEILIERNLKLNNIFLNIYYNVEKIKNANLPEEQVEIRIKQLKNYFNEIESEKAGLNITDEDLRKEIIKLFAFLNVLNDSKITIREVIDKFNRYNIQADNASNDLADHKKEALANIERERKDFTQSLNDYRNDIEKTKNNLLQQYDDLNEYHKNFENKIYKELNDIQNSVNREQLAAYFLNERKKLKGDIDIPILICTFLFECIYFLKIDCYITASWHQFIFLRICILVIGIFILFLSVAQLVKFLYSRYIEKNNEVTIKPFEELKALLTPYWCWLGLTFIGMGCIAKVAYALYYVNSTKIDHLDPYLLLANLPIFMILVWFTWFSSKQFSYTKQICDEYEYKYALSKSYLSYREEAKELAARGNNDAILVALLDSVIKNVATSPVKSVKPDCHTPFTEVFSSIRGAAKTIEDDDISRSVK